jgi:nucleoside-diphosphate-sugar epimerase
MCRSAVDHRVITVHSECAIPFDVLALEDLVPGIVKALSYEGEGLEIFNLSSGEPCSLELLAERIGAQVPGTRIEKRGVAQPAFQMSGARAARLLQWQPAPLNLRLAEMLSSLK